MPQPIESIFGLPRIKLKYRIPIMETQGLVEKYGDSNNVRVREAVIEKAKKVEIGCWNVFDSDVGFLRDVYDGMNDKGLVVTRKSYNVIYGRMIDLGQDVGTFKTFEKKAQNLFRYSGTLASISREVNVMSNRVKEISYDVCRDVGINPSQFFTQPSTSSQLSSSLSFEGLQ